MNMGMGIGLNVSTGQHVMVQQQILVKVAVRMYCPICGYEVLVDDKSSDLIWTCPFDCPSKIRACLEQYATSKIVRHDCPECFQERCVGINADDYYECRLCQTQFTICGSPEWRQTYLLDRKKMDDAFEAAIPVHVMSLKGKGEFPKDQQLAKRLKQVRTCERRLLRVLHSMRREFACEHLYFNGYGFTDRYGDPAEFNNLARDMLSQHRLHTPLIILPREPRPS